MSCASPVSNPVNALDQWFGGFFNYFITTEWFLTTSFRYGAGNDRDGSQTDIGIGWSSPFAPQWRLGLSPAPLH